MVPGRGLAGGASGAARGFRRRVVPSRGTPGWKAIGLALIFPIVIGLIAYGIAWVTGLVRFSPEPLELVTPVGPER